MDEASVDFPSMMGDGEIYLCWDLGEEPIIYWAGIDDGFARAQTLGGFKPEG